MFNVKKYTLLFIVLLLVQTGYSQKTTSYQVYNKRGKKTSTNKMLKKLQKAEVILFGELHNNPISHWLELKTIQHLHQKNNIIVGAEMFESKDQNHLNNYLKSTVSLEIPDSLIALWPNYRTDYLPLVEFAKKNQIPFIATNAPKKIVRYVYTSGLEKLYQTISESDRHYIAPLPIDYDPNLPGYQWMLNMMKDTSHANSNLPKAQAIRDATMAYHIYTNYKKTNKQFIHFNGDYHSKNFEGIYWYLKRMEKNLNVITISSVEQENVNQLEEENKSRANFIIVIDKNMTKTY
ncbi:MAG: ChaN family lipoprotein [Chitinophagales bacterium]|nr:ChaN family lipoprotein [Chitinophagales bacterium]